MQTKITVSSEDNTLHIERNGKSDHYFIQTGTAKTHAFMVDEKLLLELSHMITEILELVNKRDY